MRFACERDELVRALAGVSGVVVVGVNVGGAGVFVGV